MERMISDVKVTGVTGTAMPLRGNDIDTDRIIPARYLKETTFARMGEYPFNDPRYGGASILLVNKNFGCGSSREHAPQALLRFGIHALVGESFAAIFAGNCLMLGIPAVTVASSEIENLMKLVESNPQTGFKLDLQEKKLYSGGELAIAFDVPESSRKALLEGFWDSTAMLCANLNKVRELAAELPYMTGFRS